ncbi:MAG: ATP-binding cassette domain-containing protein [Thermoplasmatota archaeon]
MRIFDIKGARKKLGDNKVLKGIDLEVHKGEVLAMVGPSGSGKSTLLRAMNRLMELDSGTVSFKGKDIREMDPVLLRRKAVLVPQESVMLPGTVEDNVTYGPRLASSNGKCSVSGCLRDAGLSPRFAEKDASKLSGGEKKRVALARALALKPEVLLLDEPTVGVDPKKVERMEQTILDFARNRKLTVIWVTHDVAQAIRVADRIANLKKGKVKEVKRTAQFKWEGAY